MAIDTPSSEYKEMYKNWELPLTLMGGTRAMREAGKKYLPQEPNESDKAYAIRKQRTFLFNFYKRTIQSLAGQAMIKNVIVNNVPPELEGMEWNFDGTGRSLTDCAHDFFLDMMLFGKTHAYSDFPNIISSDVDSYSAFRQSGLIPYVVHVSPINLIGWRVSYDSGVPNLMNVRVYSEDVEEDPDDEFSDILVKRVQVIRQDIVEHWTKKGDEDWEQQESTDNSYGFVPIMTSYSDKSGFMTSNVPLEDLAWLNLRHWQTSSDQNNILHVVRCPFILATGFDEGDLSGAELGINRIVSTSSDLADMKFVEHTGTAITAGRQDLRDLEVQAGAIGADLIFNKSISRQTATAREIDQSESLSIIQITLRNLETMLENLYMTAGILMGVDASDVSVTLADTLAMTQEPNPTLALLQLRELGFDESTILQEAQRRGLLSSYLKETDMDLSLYRREKEADVLLKEMQLASSTEDDPDEDADTDEPEDTNDEQPEN